MASADTETARPRFIHSMKTSSFRQDSLYQCRLSTRTSYQRPVFSCCFWFGFFTFCSSHDALLCGSILNSAISARCHGIIIRTLAVTPALLSCSLLIRGRPGSPFRTVPTGVALPIGTNPSTLLLSYESQLIITDWSPVLDFCAVSGCSG